MTLHSIGRGERLGRRREYGLDAITRVVDDDSVVAIDKVVGHTVVVAQRRARGFGSAFPRGRTTFEVGEQEGDLAARKVSTNAGALRGSTHCEPRTNRRYADEV